MDGIDPLTSAPFFRFFRKYETDRSNVENGTGRDRVFFHPFQLYSYFIRQFKTFSVQKEMESHRTSFFFSGQVQLGAKHQDDASWLVNLKR